MAFPTIPTVAATRLLTGVQANTTATRTFPSLTGLTKASGDLLIAIVIAYQTTATANAAFSGWTAGWTEFKDQSSATTMAIGMAYKWSTGSETGTISVTQAATITGQAAMILMSIPGAHATTPPEAGSIANGTTTAANPAAFDPAGWAAEDTLWIAVAGDGETSTTGSFTAPTAAPTNYTGFAATAISQDAVGGVAGAVAFRQLNAASEDVGAFSVDTSNARNSAIVIAVRPAPVVITKVETLVDTFDSLDTSKWTASIPAKVASNASGYLELTPDVAYTEYVSNVDYTLIASGAWVNCVQNSSGNGSLDTVFILRPDANNYVGFTVEAGTLYSQKKIAGVITNYSATAFGPSNAWWKVSESGGTVTWAVSGDGITWTTTHTELVASLFALTAIRPVLQCGNWDGAAYNPAWSNAMFDWFNVVQPVTATSTAVARLSLASASLPFTRSLHSIRVRARLSGLGSGQIRAALYEGATNRSGDLTSSFLSTTFAEYEIAIPAAVAADITDYSNLEVRIWGYSSGGSTAGIEIAEVWLDVPSAADFPVLAQTVQRWR